MPLQERRKKIWLYRESAEAPRHAGKMLSRFHDTSSVVKDGSGGSSSSTCAVVGKKKFFILLMRCLESLSNVGSLFCPTNAGGEGCDVPQIVVDVKEECDFGRAHKRVKVENDEVKVKEEAAMEAKEVKAVVEAKEVKAVVEAKEVKAAVEAKEVKAVVEAKEAKAAVEVKEEEVGGVQQHQHLPPAAAIAPLLQQADHGCDDRRHCEGLKRKSASSGEEEGEDEFTLKYLFPAEELVGEYDGEERTVYLQAGVAALLRVTCGLLVELMKVLLVVCFSSSGGGGSATTTAYDKMKGKLQAIARSMLNSNGYHETFMPPDKAEPHLFFKCDGYHSHYHDDNDNGNNNENEEDEKKKASSFSATDAAKAEATTMMVKVPAYENKEMFVRRTEKEARSMRRLLERQAALIAEAIEKYNGDDTKNVVVELKRALMRQLLVLLTEQVSEFFVCVPKVVSLGVVVVATKKDAEEEADGGAKEEEEEELDNVFCDLLDLIEEVEE